MAAAGGQFENSAGFVQGFADAVKELALWEKLLAALEPDARRALETPHAERWWPGSVMSRTIIAVERIAGLETVEKLGYLSVKKGVAPVAMPLVKVTLAVFGATPAAIFARAPSFATTALRGVDLAWNKETDTKGLFVATYASPVPAQYGAMWRGTLNFVYELTRVDGSFGAIAHEQNGAQLRIPVEWKAR